MTRINCVPRRCLLHLLTVVINLGDGDKEIFLPLWPGGVSPLCLLLPRSGDTADKECPGPATGPGATTTDHPVAKLLHAQIVQGDFYKVRHIILRFKLELEVGCMKLGIVWAKDNV